MDLNEAQATTNAMARVLLAIVGIDLLLLVVWAWRRYAAKSPTFARRWSLLDLWLGLQGGAVLLFAASAPLLMIFVALGHDISSLDPARPAVLWMMLLSLPIQNAVFFLAPAAIVVLKYRLRLRDIGLAPLPQTRHVIAGVLIGLVAMVVSDLLGRALHALAENYQHIEWVRQALEYEKNNPVARMMEALPRAGYGALALAVLGIGIAAPLGEEMLLRGFVFNVLKRRFGLTAGLVLSSLLFTIPHSYSLGLAPVFLMGIALAWVYHNSGSLWPGIFLHATNNTLAVLLTFFFSGSNG